LSPDHQSCCSWRLEVLFSTYQILFPSVHVIQCLQLSFVFVTEKTGFARDPSLRLFQADGGDFEQRPRDFWHVWHFIRWQRATRAKRI
jgi:hypothetical protein